MVPRKKAESLNVTCGRKFNMDNTSTHEKFPSFRHRQAHTFTFVHVCEICLVRMRRSAHEFRFKHLAGNNYLR